MDSEIIYQKTDNLFEDSKLIIEIAQKFAYSAINYAITQRNWLLGKRIFGKRIFQEDLDGEKRAAYGKQIIKNLSIQLNEIYGKGFDASNRYKYIEFYKAFPILDTACLKSLSWSHFRILLQTENKDASNWYIQEAIAGVWSVRTLQRNISSQYYERRLLSQHKEQTLSAK